jgi:hypothetical protein
MGASADGGWRNIIGAFATSCNELAQSTGSTASSARASFMWTTEPLDSNFDKKCPSELDWQPQVEVYARGQSRMISDLALRFTKAFLQYHPVGIAFRRPWKALASGSVEAYVNDSAWKRAVASGEIQVGSNCSTTFAGSFSASVGGPSSGGVTVGPSAGIWDTCDTQAWPTASNPRNQPLIAEIRDVPVTLRNGQSMTVGVSATGARAEAWSADPAESTPWLEVWAMRSSASSDVRGGCMVMGFEGCNVISGGGPGIGCRIGSPALASYSTSTGVDCPGFPGINDDEP